MFTRTFHILLFYFFLLHGSNIVGQNTTYHEDYVMNQITVAEQGLGSLTPSWFYALGYNKYRRTAGLTNKLIYRGDFLRVNNAEIPLSEQIDSALKDRRRVELIRMADHTPTATDLSWQSERKKINGKLDLMKVNIGKIVSEGGTESSKQDWTERYNTIKCGLDAVRDAYMPQGNRKEQYVAIYQDLVRQNIELSAYLDYLRMQKELEGLGGNTARPRRANVISIVRRAHTQWINCISNASGGFSVDE